MAKILFPSQSNSRSKSLLIFFAFLCLTKLTLQAQTTIISPTGAGGFELGTTFAANGWTATTGTATQNQWVCSTGATAGFSGTNAAYVTNNTAGTPPPHAYTLNPAQTSHIYRDFTIPAGEIIINLSFSWISNGDTNKDKLRVYIIPITTALTFGTGVTTGGTTGAIQVGLNNYSGQSTWTTAAITLPTTYAGTTARLVFEWSNNNSGGNQRPGGVDNISLTSMPVLGDECATAIPLTVNSSCSYTTYTNAANTASAGAPAPGCASYSGGDI
jgi:hypothetical protein